MSLKLVVWDVDGTLVDSRQSIFVTAQAVYGQTGLEVPTYDEVRQIVGLGLREAFVILSPELPDAEIDRLTQTYREVFQALRRDPTFIEPLYDGAAETLDRLRGQGWKIAMATGKSRSGVETVLRLHGWADLFDSTHCADDGPGKPHPAMLLEAMKAIGVPPERTIMVGDTAHDMRMAKAAGVYAQGVSWGFHTAEEVLEGGADHVADDFTTLNLQLDAFAAGLGAR
jgi:phosphoglycolate phosphatase